MAPVCPELVQLEAYVAGSSDSAELATHVSSCAECRARSDAIRADNRLMASLATAVSTAPKRAEPAPPVAPDGYDVVRELHRGGQGIVLEAVQRSTQRRVALKVLLEGALATAAQRARFDREIDTVLRLRHPNLVTVYDRGTTRDGRAFFAMELVEGVTLDQHSRARRAAGWPRRETLELFLKLCGAVSYAHQRGVIHRDLKPGNVLIDAAGEPRVLDFGLAKAVADEATAAAATVTRPGWFLGTLAWAAPEQLRGDPDQVDVRSDVYALGVILFELLTGAFPYPVDRPLPELARAIVESDPDFPRGFDDELRAILARALAKEREARYQSAGELGRDVERFLNGEPIDAKRGRLGYLLRKTLRRYRVRAAAAAAMLLVIVGAAIFSTLAWRRAEDDAERARIEGTTRRRVADFVSDMLASLNPDRARGRTLSVAEIVDDAARRLDHELHEEPAIERDLRVVLGCTYRSLGLLDEAERQLARALDLARKRPDEALALAGALCELAGVARERGDVRHCEELCRDAIATLERTSAHGSREMARALNDLALIRLIQRDSAGAEPLFTRSIEAFRALGDEAEIATSLSNLGQLLASRGQTVEAERRLRESLAIRARIGELDRAATTWTLVQLGDLLAGTGRLGDARAAYEQALALQGRLFGPDDPRAIATLVALARVVALEQGYAAAAELHAEAKQLRPALVARRSLGAAKALDTLAYLASEAGDAEAAQRDGEASLAMHVELVGEEHLSTALVRRNLGGRLFGRGRYAEADRLLRRSLATFRRIGGDGSELVAQTALDLAWCCDGRFDAAAAERFAREALEAFTAIHGPEDPRTLRSLDALAWAIHRGGRHAEAEELAREGVERLRGQDPPQPELLAAALGNLGEMVESTGRVDDAKQLYEEAIALAREELPDPTLAAAANLHRLGRLLLVRGQMDEALPFLEEALAMRRELVGDGHLVLIYSLNTTGTWHMRRGEVDRAAPLFEEAVETARRVLEPSHPDLAIALANLATVKTARGEHAAAELLLLESHPILRRARGDLHPDTRSVADLLAKHYRTIGRPQEAARYALPSLGPPAAR